MGRRVVKTVNKEFCCIAEIMLHVVTQPQAIYAGTAEFDTFLIYHDGLKQWWERSAQNYLAYLGFANRQLKAYGDTNRDTIYCGSVVGNSPDMARGLDAHGFSDLSRSVEYHTALTYLYEPNDPRKFEMETPKQVWKTLARCWEMAPSLERIIDDVMALLHVLGNIVAAEGCVVW